MVCPVDTGMKIEMESPGNRVLDISDVGAVVCKEQKYVKHQGEKELHCF